MKFLKELKDGLQAKIEQFLEEHPAAVPVAQKAGNLGDNRYQVYHCLYRLLDKDGKETNFYLQNYKQVFNDDCGCQDLQDGITVFEEADLEKIKNFTEKFREHFEKYEAEKLFNIHMHDLYECRMNNYREDKNADICGMKADHEMVVNLIRKIKEQHKI